MKLFLKKIIFSFLIFGLLCEHSSIVSMDDAAASDASTADADAATAATDAATDAATAAATAATAATDATDATAVSKDESLGTSASTAPGTPPTTTTTTAGDAAITSFQGFTDDLSPVQKAEKIITSKTAELNKALEAQSGRTGSSGKFMGDTRNALNSFRSAKSGSIEFNAAQDPDGIYSDKNFTNKEMSDYADSKIRELTDGNGDAKSGKGDELEKWQAIKKSCMDGDNVKKGDFTNEVGDEKFKITNAEANGINQERITRLESEVESAKANLQTVRYQNFSDLDFSEKIKTLGQSTKNGAGYAFDATVSGTKFITVTAAHTLMAAIFFMLPGELLNSYRQAKMLEALYDTVKSKQQFGNLCLQIPQSLVSRIDPMGASQFVYVPVPCEGDYEITPSYMREVGQFYVSRPTWGPWGTQFFGSMNGNTPLQLVELSTGFNFMGFGDPVHPGTPMMPFFAGLQHEYVNAYLSGMAGGLGGKITRGTSAITSGGMFGGTSVRKYSVPNSSTIADLFLTQQTTGQRQIPPKVLQSTLRTIMTPMALPKDFVLQQDIKVSEMYGIGNINKVLCNYPQNVNQQSISAILNFLRQNSDQSGNNAGQADVDVLLIDNAATNFSKVSAGHDSARDYLNKMQGDKGLEISKHVIVNGTPGSQLDNNCCVYQTAQTHIAKFMRKNADPGIRPLLYDYVVFLDGGKNVIPFHVPEFKTDAKCGMRVQLMPNQQIAYMSSLISGVTYNGGNNLVPVLNENNEVDYSIANALISTGDASGNNVGIVMNALMRNSDLSDARIQITTMQQVAKHIVVNGPFMLGSYQATRVDFDEFLDESTVNIAQQKKDEQSDFNVGEGLQAQGESSNIDLSVKSKKAFLRDLYIYRIDGALPAKDDLIPDYVAPVIVDRSKDFFVNVPIGIQAVLGDSAIKSDHIHTKIDFLISLVTSRIYDANYNLIAEPDFVNVPKRDSSFQIINGQYFDNVALSTAYMETEFNPYNQTHSEDSDKIFMPSMYWVTNFSKFARCDFSQQSEFLELGTLSFQNVTEFGGALQLILPEGFVGNENQAGSVLNPSLTFVHHQWASYLRSSKSSIAINDMGPFNFTGNVNNVINNAYVTGFSQAAMMNSNFFYHITDYSGLSDIDSSDIFVMAHLKNSSASLPAKISLKDLDGLGNNFDRNNKVISVNNIPMSSAYFINIADGSVYQQGYQAPQQKDAAATSGVYFMQRVVDANTSIPVYLDQFDVLNQVLENEHEDQSVVIESYIDNLKSITTQNQYASQSVVAPIKSENQSITFLSQDLASIIPGLVIMGESRKNRTLSPHYFCGSMLRLNPNAFDDSCYIYAVVEDSTTDFMKANDYWIEFHNNAKGEVQYGGLISSVTLGMISLVSGNINNIDGSSNNIMIQDNLQLGDVPKTLFSVCNYFSQDKIITRVKELNFVLQQKKMIKKQDEISAPSLPYQALEAAVSVSTIFDIRQVGSKYYLRQVSKSFSSNGVNEIDTISYLDFNAVDNITGSLKKDVDRGVMYIVITDDNGNANASPVESFEGLTLQGLRARYGISVGVDGVESLTIPVMTLPIMMSLQDKTLQPGLSGDEMVCSDIQFSNSNLNERYYFYFNRLLNDFFVRVVRSQQYSVENKTTQQVKQIDHSDDYYVNLTTGLRYSVDGSPLSQNIILAFPVDKNNNSVVSMPLFVWGDTIIKHMYAQNIHNAYERFTSNVVVGGANNVSDMEYYLIDSSKTVYCITYHDPSQLGNVGYVPNGDIFLSITPQSGSSVAQYQGKINTATMNTIEDCLQYVQKKYNADQFMINYFLSGHSTGETLMLRHGLFSDTYGVYSQDITTSLWNQVSFVGVDSSGNSLNIASDFIPSSNYVVLEMLFVGDRAVNSTTLPVNTNNVVDYAFIVMDSKKEYIQGIMYDNVAGNGTKNSSGSYYMPSNGAAAVGSMQSFTGVQMSQDNINMMFASYPIITSGSQSGGGSSMNSLDGAHYLSVVPQAASQAASSVSASNSTSVASSTQSIYGIVYYNDDVNALNNKKQNGWNINVSPSSSGIMSLVRGFNVSKLVQMSTGDIDSNSQSLSEWYACKKKNISQQKLLSLSMINDLYDTQKKAAKTILDSKISNLLTPAQIANLPEAEQKEASKQVGLITEEAQAQYNAAIEQCTNQYNKDTADKTNFFVGLSQEITTIYNNMQQNINRLWWDQKTERIIYLKNSTYDSDNVTFNSIVQDGSYIDITEGFVFDSNGWPLGYAVSSDALSQILNATGLMPVVQEVKQGDVLVKTMQKKLAPLGGPC